MGKRVVPVLTLILSLATVHGEPVCVKKKEKKCSRTELVERYADGLEQLVRATQKEMRALLDYQERTVDEISALAHDEESWAATASKDELTQRLKEIDALHAGSVQREVQVRTSFVHKK